MSAATNTATKLTRTELDSLEVGDTVVDSSGYRYVLLEPGRWLCENPDDPDLSPIGSTGMIVGVAVDEVNGLPVEEWRANQRPARSVYDLADALVGNLLERFMDDGITQEHRAAAIAGELAIFGEPVSLPELESLVDLARRGQTPGNALLSRLRRTISGFPYSGLLHERPRVDTLDEALHRLEELSDLVKRYNAKTSAELDAARALRSDVAAMQRVLGIEPA